MKAPRRDENSIYEKTISCAVILTLMHFLDAFFLVTNAPGRNAFNRVDRRMASFSKELGGVLLKHEDFGAHLDDKGNTIDPQPKLKNFEHAGKIFAKFGVGWSSMAIQ